MVRIFIAVELPEEIRNAIANVQQNFSGVGRFSFVSPNMMHITLKFIGEVSDASVGVISRKIDELNTMPYSISVSKVSTFGNPPRVIKAEVHDNNVSAQLASALDSIVKPLGIPAETRTFSPHITIARVKEGSSSMISKMVDTVKDRTFGTAEITEIVIKKSVLTPSGPLYTTLHRKKL